MTTLPEPVLAVRDLHFAYPGQPALAQAWSAHIGPGVTLLHGDTGSGKSTLLRLLAGTQPADAGQLTLGGVRLDATANTTANTTATATADVAAYRRQVFWFDPHDAALDALTPPEHAAALQCAQPLFDLAAWRRHAEGLGLDAHLHKPLYQLSTGTRRKVGLAAALASSSALTLLDEPTGALDGPSVAYLLRALAALATHPTGATRAVLVASSDVPAGVAWAAVIHLPLARRSR